MVDECKTRRSRALGLIALCGFAIFSACGSGSSDETGKNEGHPPDAASDTGTPDAGLDSGLDGCVDCEQPRLYFESNTSGHYEIWSSAADRTDANPLTDDADTSAWWPRVSPTEDLVYFYRTPTTAPSPTNDYASASLWRMKRDGTDEQQVRPAKTDGWFAQGVINFSPDGKRVVMAALVETQPSKKFWHLFEADADLSHLERMTTRDLLFLDPSWSPDGKRLVYVAIPKDTVLTPDDLGSAAALFSHLEIFTSNADGSDETQLTFDSTRDNDPFWSPDGTEIVFESAVDPAAHGGIGRWALRAVPAEGGTTRVVIDDGNVNTVGRWTQDSQTLYFHRFDFDAPGWVLATLARDGSHLRTLTPGNAANEQDCELAYPVMPGK